MPEMKTNPYWIWLTQIPGIGSKRFLQMLEIFGEPQNVFDADSAELKICRSQIGERTFENLLKHKTTEFLDKAIEITVNKEIHVITFIDDEYPSLLKEIYDPPMVLYSKGLPINNISPTISIVGSRRTSEYGRQMADKFSKVIAESGISVVSGAARGIDTISHFGAIKAKGYTIAVLGCGVDVVYPRENKKLFSQIEENGTLLSEYQPGTYPAPANFPARNRIISGLSKVLLVIEAGERSGALITVDFALEQGRDVFALPGNTNNPFCTGTNRLLKDGARLITDPIEIIEEYNINFKFKTEKTSSKAIQLDFFENEILKQLEEGEKYIEQLADNIQINIGKLNAALTMLEIKGLIKQLPGNIFIRRN